ncbi:MAG: type II toxin-antitoxin system Phd/YefM family antitoxin [bacterium]
MRYVPVEDARKRLGRLVQEVREEGPVTIGRRGREQAVLLSEEEYARLRRSDEEAAKARFAAALKEIQAEVRRRGIPRSVVTSAIRSARKK